MKKLASLTDLELIVENYFKSIEHPAITTQHRRKDLKHIAFWHQYYANTASNISQDLEPKVLNDTYASINEQLLADMENFNNEQLKKVIRKSQSTLARVLPKIAVDKLFPYKQGSRKYSINEYIDVIHTHFRMHVDYNYKIIEAKDKTKFT